MSTIKDEEVLYQNMKNISITYILYVGNITISFPENIVQIKYRKYTILSRQAALQALFRTCVCLNAAGI